MSKHQNDRLQGTLDLLILKVLARSGPLHGYVIAQRIHDATGDYLRIEEGSLYPALYRMTNDKWLRAEWVLTDRNRKPRSCATSPAGRKKWEKKERRVDRWTRAVAKALRFP